MPPSFIPPDHVRAAAAQRKREENYILRRVSVLRGTRLPLWTGDDLAFFHHHKDRFTRTAQHQAAGDLSDGGAHLGATHLDAYGSEIPAQTAMQSRVTVVPKFGLLWVGIAALVTVGATAIWHGSRHEREARAGTRSR